MWKTPSASQNTITITFSAEFAAFAFLLAQSYSLFSRSCFVILFLVWHNELMFPLLFQCGSLDNLCLSGTYWAASARQQSSSLYSWHNKTSTYCVQTFQNPSWSLAILLIDTQLDCKLSGIWARILSRIMLLSSKIIDLTTLIRTRFSADVESCAHSFLLSKILYTNCESVEYFCTQVCVQKLSDNGCQGQIYFLQQNTES